ncbi:MAG: OsmC family protein [Gemmatimonadetes bacterium]|nr:OsmC family protein [Gemmatimonadota bacterium]
MTGTLGGALEARGIAAGDGRLWAEGRGEIETDEGVLVIRRIFVCYHLRASASQREAAERAHSVHHGKCPVYRTIHRCVDITTELVLEED